MPVGDATKRAIRAAARAIATADALLITAGAGMSADSGLIAAAWLGRSYVGATP